MLKHLRLGTVFHVLKSLWCMRFITKESISKHYFGLPAYIHANTSLRVGKKSTIRMKDEGFLAFGTEDSSFRSWAKNGSIYMKEGSTLEISGFVNVGRGSLLWLLEGASISIGRNTYFAGLNIVTSASSIKIGADCAIAWDVTISDNDFHDLTINGKQKKRTTPIIIEDRVWIGMGAKILKGVTIGHDSVIGAGAVIRRDVEPHSLVIGNDNVVSECVDGFDLERRKSLMLAEVDK